MDLLRDQFAICSPCCLAPTGSSLVAVFRPLLVPIQAFAEFVLNYTAL
ncbi:hypothetical protein SUBVAR_04270 [Subdoligranulum variabile DSM 15176]|uniref:Uncharacterized protein n=1 Tax=Subdoligranulum variabile DSM 15176 TaxID=411471 RepID=D1PIV5_9FIRM|nr:hypothetical protein SUBVAR_04270 [Subdoligranulum variabile DSM 15176]